MLFSDEELVSKAAGLREEQDKWNDLFATKLIELLDKIDDLQANVKAEMSSAADQRLSAEELESSRDLLCSLKDRLTALQDSLEREEKKIREDRSRMETLLASAERNEQAAVTARNCLEGAIAKLKIAEEKTDHAERRLDEAETIQKESAANWNIAVDRLHSAGVERRRAEAAYSKASDQYGEAVKLLKTVVTLSYCLIFVTFLIGLMLVAFRRWVGGGHIGWISALAALLITTSLFWFARVMAIAAGAHAN